MSERTPTSPRPWFVLRHDSGSIHVMAEQEIGVLTAICTMNESTMVELPREANAEYIAHACNLFPELVAALEHVWLSMGLAPDGTPTITLDGYQTVASALAKVAES